MRKQQYILINNNSPIRMDFSEPETTLGKTIKAHIEDEDGDASKVEVLTLSKNELI